jgi:predicted Na+-dependent transporter
MVSRPALPELGSPVAAVVTADEGVSLSIPEIINGALSVSIFLGVLAVGMTVEPADLASLLRAPSRLIRSLLAMNILFPVVAVLICRLFSLHPAMIVALLTLAISPVGALFSQSMLAYVAPGNASYARGLFFASIVLSVILTPLAVEIIQAMIGGGVRVKPFTVGEITIGSVLMPLGIGLTITRLRPGAKRWVPAIQKVSAIVLRICTVTRLALALSYLGVLFRQGTVAAIALITLIGLVIGHIFGGPDHDDRTVLALATVSRHPGVATAVARLTAQPQATIGVLLAVAVSDLATKPYKRWRRRRARERPPTV